jgi:XRE family transcriptional regulator, regulator of sulfur utilization
MYIYMLFIYNYCKLRMNILGHNIKKIRELKNYSQQHLAFTVGMSQSAYSHLEKGRTRISDDKLKKIANALEVEVGLILNFSEKTILKNIITIEKINSKMKEVTDAYEVLLKNKEEEISSLRQQLGIP